MATEPVNAWALYDAWEDLSNGRHGMEQATRDAVRAGVQRSAGIVLPMVFDQLGTPDSMLDVGAGEGWWCAKARDLGVPWTAALDRQSHMNCGMPVAGWNAEAHERLPDGPWPLALCLEVAEHVTPAAGDHLVAELCRVADEIVWSAAIPGQGGDGHINEQWPDYWSERFNRHGFAFDDPWRADLWDKPGVEPWYAQNLLLAYRHGVTVRVDGEGPAGDRPMRSAPPLALVHPVTWAHHRGVPGPRS